jgi:hypothetical protein
MVTEGNRPVNLGDELLARFPARKEGLQGTLGASANAVRVAASLLAEVSDEARPLAECGFECEPSSS